jgi:hypothetical protein
LKKSAGVTFEDVRKIAATLPNVEESTSYGTPAFKVQGALFMRLRDDLDSLVIRVERDRRQEMIDADPEVYFLTDHYLNYPWILVRMSHVRPDALRDLLHGAWQLAIASKKRKRNGNR